jgi:hypothetical protein
VIRRLVVLVLLIGGAVLLKPLRAPTEGVIAPRSLLLFGILLLTADTFGALSHDAGLPRLVGYLLAGLALGPSVMAIVPAGVLEDLGMMKRLAVGVIGLLAGAELRPSDLRARWRAIFWILSLQVAAVLLAVWGAILLSHPWVPFLAELDLQPLVFVALLFAATLAVNSPMVTLAMLTETGARGPLARTTLGVVLVADVVVILFVHGGLQPGRGQPGRRCGGRACSVVPASSRNDGLDLCWTRGRRRGEPVPPVCPARAGGVRGRRSLRDRGGSPGAPIRASPELARSRILR